MLIDQTVADSLAAETAIERLYRSALSEWAIRVEPFVLPSLTASGELPPDPDAAADEAATTTWMDIAEGLVVGGLVALWSLQMVRSMQAMDRDVPEPGEVDNDRMPDDVAVSVVASEMGVARQAVVDAITALERDPEMRARIDEMRETTRQLVSRTPQAVRGKLATVTRDMTDRAEIVARMREVVVPDSPELADIARLQSDVAASVQNDAVVQAAADSGDEDLEKVWIATLDSKTRRTHWAADGQRVPLDGTFAIGRDDLRYPADPRGSDAETRNCRCRVGVQRREDPLPAEVDRHTERLDGRDSTARNREGSQEDEVRRRLEDNNPRARDAVTAAAYSAEQTDTEESTEMDPDESTTATLAADETDAESESAGETFRTFTDSVVAVTGEHTSDGRMLSADIDLRFRTMPLPLMWVKQSSMGHLDAFTVGVIEEARVDGGVVYASGYLMNSAEADEAAEQIAHGITGPSVDLADTEWVLTDEDGKEITEEEWWDLPMDAKVYQTVTSAELIGTTLVSTPAFGQTTISLNSERESRDVALVASAAEEFRPRTYPAAMFSNPRLTGPTPIQMDDSGRIFGHLACYGECHRSIQNECVMVPRTTSEYSQFLTSPPVRLDDGTQVPVGRLTVGTGHADDRLSGKAAVAHYDNTGTCFALVTVGEDDYGVWVSGVAAPWATAEQIEQGLSAPLSGDWRAYRGRLELHAALAVNTPGYVVRGATDSAGRPLSLVASMAPSRDAESSTAALTPEAVADIVRQTVMATREEDAKARRIFDVEAMLGKVPDTRAEQRKAEIDGLFAKVGE